MDNIKSITIGGYDEYDEYYYDRTYTYERDTGEYHGFESGAPFDCEGGGGNLDFDISECDIEYCDIEYIDDEDDEEE